MSKTILSPNGESKVITVRRTESIDIPNIFKLIDLNTEKYFGKLNVFNFIEKAVFSICLVDEDDEIYGHATFFDFPNVDGVDPASWEDWLSAASKSSYTPLNTLFIGLFASKKDYMRGCMREILHTMFIAVPDVHYCFLILPENVSLDNSFVNIFRNIAQLQQSVGDKFFTIFISERYMFEPMLYIRNARVEDTDELTPLFDSLNNTLQAVYGDYYLAELIESQNEEMQCIVAEVNDYAVGLMSINSNVDVEFLNSSYNLEVFHSLEQKKAGLANRNQKITFANGSAIFQKSEEFTFLPVPNNSLVSFDQNIDDQSDMAISAESSTEMGKPHQSWSAEDVDPHSVAHTGSDFKSDQKTNAFYIQLFAINEKYQTRAEDFLMKAFELFPDFDMCIISIPHLVPEFPLLRLFVIELPGLSFLHITDIKVRKACTSDFENIWFLTRNIRQQEKLLDDLQQFNDCRRDNDGTDIMAYVATVADRLIGVAVLRNEEDIKYLRSHYNIEDYIYFNHHEQSEHAHLYHFIMNPAFKYLSKFFMREILRQSYKNCLYYPLFPIYASQAFIGSHSIITALSDMIPVRYRRQIIYPPNLGINAPSDQVLKEIPAFALTHMNRKLALEPKMTINARIVVVGASTVSLSFLETLIFCPHLNFNNITLISPHGLPAESMPNPHLQNMMASNFYYSPDDLARTSLSSWVSVVKSKMTKIVREKKHLITSNGHTIPYDHLFLCCGLQYTSVIWDAKNPFGKQDHSFFVINNLVEAAEAIKWIAQNILCAQVWSIENVWKLGPLPGVDKTGNIIVYGDSLDAYCFLRTILDLGILGKFIHLMIPTTDKVVPEMSDYVEEVILAELVKQNVQIHFNCDFVKWSSIEDSSSRYAYFHDRRKSFKIEYVVFFCYHAKKIDYSAFKAINDACLIVDHKIVINNDFHTVDPNIWAAGTFTKYQRVLYSDNWVHSKFSSKEIGFTLANKILKIFNPAMNENETKNLPEDTELVTTYIEPRISSALLPGGFHYLNVCRPAINNEFYESDVQTGYVLKTGKPTDPCGYFEVLLNRYKQVETITCLRKEPFAASNFVELYGVHESILNNMLQRYEEGLIKDFFSFFMEPYCLPIYHDRFKDIRQEIRQVILDEKGMCNINAELRELLQDTDGVAEMFPKSDLRNLIDRYMQTNAPRRLVEHHVLAYLYYNYYHLPMFAKPGCI
ncbi:cilia- and flagella-associated protein 61 [Octopus bimaculoides]|uniref:cilia- and flagella-associated protein 61 n=1 Tax=Octopus bimaculoides TaxID=37653 RepID=UPI00071D85E0|nr:cilia- and flagella-associated protein 61 [Octopus bimaculoides]|eukprot:XP_014784216.1 PREDICTED: cilia- and flagella-associated protein 61-like [Octopus bimaculoides]